MKDKFKELFLNATFIVSLIAGIIFFTIIYSISYSIYLNFEKREEKYQNYLKIKNNGCCKGFDMFLHKHLRW